jgi:hypothetical protein
MGRLIGDGDQFTAVVAVYNSAGNYPLRFVYAAKQVVLEDLLSLAIPDRDHSGGQAAGY